MKPTINIYEFFTKVTSLTEEEVEKLNEDSTTSSSTSSKIKLSDFIKIMEESIQDRGDHIE